MTEAEARAEISVLCDAGTEPVLASADLDLLLRKAKRVDKYGVWPTETGWTQTYDVNYGAATGWLLKAGRLANRYLFMSGGKMFSRQQYYDHCIKMYRLYLSKSPIKATRLTAEDTAIARLASVPNNWNP